MTAQLFHQHKDSSGMLRAISTPFGPQAWCGGREMATVLAEGRMGCSPMERWLGDPKEEPGPKSRTLQTPRSSFRLTTSEATCLPTAVPFLCPMAPSGQRAPGQERRG